MNNLFRWIRAKIWVGVWMGLWMGLPLAAQADQPLTLEQALALAWDDNPALEEARGRIAQARAARDEARAAFWPRLDAGLEYLRGDAPSAYLFKTIDARQLPENVDFNHPGRFENFESYLEARLNVYAGGRDRLRFSQAETRFEQARHAYQTEHNDLSAAVVDTYLAMLSARDRGDIARQSVAVLEREVDLAEVRLRGGSLLRSELLSLQVRLAEARADRVRAAAASQRLQAALAILLGRDAATAFEPRDEEPDFPLPEDYSQALRRALEQRPELAAAAGARELARLEERLARAEYLPRLDVQARLYHDDPDFAYNDDQLNWTFGARLSWNLFSGFTTRAREAHALGQTQESRAAQRRMRQAVEFEVRQAWLDLEEHRANLDLAEAALAHAEEAFTQVRVQFDGGAVEVTRYLDAELAWARARVNASAARRDHQRAQAELARAMGDWRPLSGAEATAGPATERFNHGQDP
ncbi:TolC family protein [Geoalkalibacter halelectricus]|uniref:TolC family protein n=1 Tax=Geoalkalibacter halelectricus TaxID=2847045 RepID=UPI00266FF87F|nr:TolC family protein [Geoalkalibacter halelectricus]